MNLIYIQKNFSTQKKCIKYLEKLRWNNKPVCPVCKCTHITPRKDSFRYHCSKCNRDFSVLTGTIFDSCHIPLPKFFQLILIMLNAKSAISASELARLINISVDTSWYACMRVRCAMIEPVNDLHGTIEADESYLGGNPRKRYKQRDNVTSLSRVETLVHYKRGRGTDKTGVAGMVERRGRVVTRVMDTFNTRNMLGMLKRYVKQDTVKKIITDKARFYNKFDDHVKHLSIKHTEQFAKGPIHINTIEGFWSIVKNSIRGSYKSLSKKYLPFYLAEFSYRYNHRKKRDNIFSSFMKNAVAEDKCFINYKPKKSVKRIVYKFKKKKNGKAKRCS